jgi:tetratricopeptide (TPR) repeat protein
MFQRLEVSWSFLFGPSETAELNWGIVLRSPIVKSQKSSAAATLSQSFKNGFWLGAFICVTVMNLACIKSQNHIGSESLLIQKSSSKNPPTKIEPFPYKSGTGQQDLSPAVTGKLPSQPSDIVKSTTTSHNTEKLEERFPEVSEALQEVSKDPASAENHFRLAELYHFYRVYDLAMEEYQWASELDPDNPRYYESLGRLCRDSGAFQSGIDSIQKALQLDKDNVEGWNTLGTIYDRLGNHGQAQQAYSKALSINPGLDYVYNNLCSSFLETGEYMRALPHCEKAVQLNPSFSAAQNNLGIVCGMLGDSSKAYEAFLRAGDSASAHNNLGWVLLQRSDLKAASEQFKLAAKLRPNYRIASKNYFLTQSLIFKRDGRTAAKSEDGSQFQSIDDKVVYTPAKTQIESVDRLKLDLKVLPTALDHEYIISRLCGRQEGLKTADAYSDINNRIVVGYDFLKRQAILKQN